MFVNIRLYLFLFFLSFCFEGIAQNDAIVESQLLYMKRTQFGMNLNSTGLGGINFKMGWHKTGRINNMLDFDLSRIRHLKETRIYSIVSDNPRQYTFGRLNMAFFLRVGYGQNIAITERPYKNAASLHFNYSVGLSTAILKPIYLDILKNESGHALVVSERYDPAIHFNPYMIMGNASFMDGMNQLTFVPGGYGKCSLAVEWGQYPDEFKSLEAGFTVDAFSKPLELMAFTSADYLFFTMFIEYTFGFNK